MTRDTGDRPMFVGLTTLFPQEEQDKCRVCDGNVSPPYRKYCSDYCKSVADAVSDLYEWRKIRSMVLSRDDYECQKCGDRAKTADHIIPVSKGGHPFDPDNLQAMCQSCNSQKGDKEKDWRGETGGTTVGKRDIRQMLFSEVSDR